MTDKQSTLTTTERAIRLELQNELTKREMFAMAAMQGLCANSIAGSHHAPDFLSKEAVMYADALLAELERTK